jgi:hypothetical protein
MVAPPRVTRIAVTSIHPQSSAGRSASAVGPASMRSRIQVDAVFRQALKYR